MKSNINMQTSIRITPSELNNQFLDMLKMIVSQNNITEINISMSDTKPKKKLREETPFEVRQKIEIALREINSGDTSHFVNFTADEFEQIAHSLTK